MLTIYDITDPDFSDNHWQAYYDMMVEANKRYDSLLSYANWQNMKKVYLSYAEMDKEHTRFVIFEKIKAVGWVMFTVKNYGTPNQMTYLALDALYDKIPAKFAKVLAPEFLRLMKQYDSKTIEFMSNCRRTTELGKMWNGNLISRMDRYQLTRKDANYDQINSWLENIPKNNPELNLDFYNEIPNKYISRFAELFTIFLNEMPQERPNPQPFHVDDKELRRVEEWRKKNNHALYIYFLVNKNDEIIGFSMAPINCDNPAYVYQSMTGVLSNFRGRGLSKWLKAALFKKIGEDFPDNKIMTTDMRAINEPIQTVNAQMGYKLVNHGHEIEIGLEKLANYCNDLRS